MYCEFCGTSMDEGVSVCGVCGNERRGGDSPREKSVAVAEAPGSFVLEGPRCPVHETMPLVGNCPRCGKQVCVRCAPDAALDNFTCTDCKGMTVAHQRAPADAKCAVHPEATASFICSRCGSFACAACRALNPSADGLCTRCGDSDGLTLATRGNRFLANMVDNLVVFGPMLLGMLAFGIFAGVTGQKNKNIELLVWPAILLGLLLGSAVQLIAQVNWGQSIGKRILGIKVVRLNGQPIELWRLIFLRNIAIHAIAQLCGLVGIVDAVMIFSADQRCLHDYLADSKVVVATR
jgi:uncharacterized RDD family membrane protein YckC